MAGRWVYVQRRSPLAQWVNVKKVRLGDTGAKRFTYQLRKGRNVPHLHDDDQAGAGLLWSHSRTLLINKR